MQEIVLNCQLREKSKKSVLNAERRKGNIPAVLYGGRDNINLFIPGREFLSILRSGVGENAIFSLVVDGKKLPVMVKEKQLHPVTDKIRHLDFIEISLKEKITVNVPVHVEGTAKGVVDGGILEYITREISVKCLPTEIPKFISLDITELAIGKGLHVSALKLPPGIEVLTPSDALLVHIIMAKEEVVPAPGEVPLVEGAAVAAEPEVIKKGKKEEEGELAEGAKPAAPGAKTSAVPGTKTSAAPGAAPKADKAAAPKEEKGKK